jgi:hypothetical protein
MNDPIYPIDEELEHFFTVCENNKELFGRYKNSFKKLTKPKINVIN